ncbi:MAG TPA: hypothetical protein VN256_13020 [Pyrinomonadaceae bacterium]|nr:hypothetical protein [Pyrinomonadaceae bacterium]
MGSEEYKRQIDSKLARLAQLESERDRLAGEVEDLRSLRKGALMRETFEREYQSLYVPTVIEMVA